MGTKEVEYVKVKPPASLVQPTPIPEFNGTKYGDLVEHIPVLEDAIRKGNEKLKDIEMYYDKAE